MTTSGAEMHRLLIEGVREAEQRYAALRDAEGRFHQQRGELDQDRGDALRDLAEHYLPDLSAESIRSAWSDLQHRLNEVLMRQEDRRRQLTAESERISQQRGEQDERLLQLDRELDQARQQRRQLSQQVESELAADERFVALSEKAATAEAALERAENNLEEIEQDATRKLPAYEQSALFTYLRDQKFGTDAYGKRGFTRRMDRRLAKYIGFQRAKQAYDFLTQTPEQMRKLIAEDRRALDTVMEELEQRRDRAVARTGLQAAIDQVQRLTRRREACLLELDQLARQATEVQNELADVEDPQGSHYREAVEVFRTRLAKLETEQLADQARETPSLTDDQIVARIQGVEQELDALDADKERYQQTLREMRECVDALGRLVQQFRAARFDGARSNFLPSLDITALLQATQTHRDVEELWDRLRRAQRWGPIPEDASDEDADPANRVLVGAMGKAAGATLGDHARRAGSRRGQAQRGQAQRAQRG